MEDYGVKIYIDKSKLMFNIEYLKKLKNKKSLPVLKANAYGHGLREIVNILYESGIKEYAVARLYEAEQILDFLENKSDYEVVIFESIHNLNVIKKNKSLIMSINSYEELENALHRGIPSEQMKLKIDFGFARNGFHYKDIEKLKEIIFEKNLYFNGIFTHLFSVNYKEGVDIINKFSEIVIEIGKERFKVIDLQNSMGIFEFDCEIATHLRAGVLNYGLQEGGYFNENLKQAFSLKGKVAGISEISNSKYIAYREKDEKQFNGMTKVAKVKIGYGDGFLKVNENTKCIIRNKEFKIIQVTMDTTFIVIDDRIKQGDEVIFYNNIYKISSETGLRPTEILTILSPRLERVII